MSDTVDLRTAVFAALVELLPAVGHDAEAEEFRSLRHRAAGVAAGAAAWRQAFVRAVAEPRQVEARLIRLTAGLELGAVELATLVLALAVEEDVALGAALAAIQRPVGEERPCLGLLELAFRPLADGGSPTVQLMAGRALAVGLLELDATDRPLPQRCVRLPTSLAVAMRAQSGSDEAARAGDSRVVVAWPGAQPGRDRLLAVDVPLAERARARREAGELAGRPEETLLIRAPHPADGDAIARLIAAALDRTPLFLGPDAETRGLGAFARACRLMPVFQHDAARTLQVPSLPGLDVAPLVVAGIEGMACRAGGGPVSGWDLEVPRADQRVVGWRGALGPGREEFADQLARRWRAGNGTVAELAGAASRLARLRAAAEFDHDDVREASWDLAGRALGALATPVRDRVEDGVLVVPPRLGEELEVLVQHCRHREALVDGLGPAMAARYRPGVRALFSGPSGTGKTLAASWLARRLGVPLFRVDLASVTSKWIGETEENLSSLFAAAERCDLVLLFDEADAMFGQRTERVRDATDRFANAQTNYLLQRLESFAGIAVLTTNSKSRLDQAFIRRLDRVVEFSLPGVEERRQLWQRHLGADSLVDGVLVDRLAARAAITGGQIRNVVGEAQVRALGEGRARCEDRDLLAALGSEFRKLGKQMPAGFGGVGADGVG